MIHPIPTTEDAAFLGFALVDALIDLLVEKGVISKGEITFLMATLAEKMANDKRAVSQRSGEFLSGLALRNEGIE